MPRINNRRTRRRAVIRPGEIVAECPIGAICSLRGEKTSGVKEPRWIDCGHYFGTGRDMNGQHIFCGFSRG